METVENKLAFFSELISCNGEIYLWEYDLEMRLLRSNCPIIAALSTIFSMDSHPDAVIAHIRQHAVPMIVTNDMGMMWIADAERENDQPVRIYLLGPIFTAELPIKSIQKGLNRLNLSLALRDEVLEMLQRLPVIALTRLFEYGIMFHYCLTGQKMLVTDFAYQNDSQLFAPMEGTTHPDTRSSWAFEQEFLKNVREGNLKYREKRDRLISNDNLGCLSTGDPIRQTKNTIIISIALVTRAAVSGGLSPEIAYTLSDHYVQSVEACNTIPEIVEINDQMEEDFIQRVHRIRQNSGLSNSIKKCCDYINYHIDQNISVQEVAEYVGYTNYYLGKKFLKEMGCTVKQYIRNGKIERAQHLLRSGGHTVQEVSEVLGYISQSYFTKQFKEVTGITPSAFKEHFAGLDKSPLPL